MKVTRLFGPLLAAALPLAGRASVSPSAWREPAADPASFGVLAALPPGAEVWQLTRLAGIAGIAEEVQVWRGGGKGQLACRVGRRWRLRDLSGPEAERLWRGLEDRGGFSLETSEDASRSAPDSAVGWTSSRFRVPEERPTKPSELFAPRRRVAAGDVRRVRAILDWLRRAYGLPRVG